MPLARIGFFFQAEDGIRDDLVTGVQTCALPISRRLKRLEWTTRSRPVHINTLFLGAFSPRDEKDFLYAPGGEFQGEAALLLDALGISTAGKAAEAVHAEFQRAGFFLTHILEGPLEEDESLETALKKRLAAVTTRVRRPLNPHRVIPAPQTLAPLAQTICLMAFGCPVLF